MSEFSITVQGATFEAFLGNLERVYRQFNGIVRTMAEPDGSPAGAALKVEAPKPAPQTALRSGTETAAASPVKETKPRGRPPAADKAPSASKPAKPAPPPRDALFDDTAAGPEAELAYGDTTLPRYTEGLDAEALLDVFRARGQRFIEVFGKNAADGQEKLKKIYVEFGWTQGIASVKADRDGQLKYIEKMDVLLGRDPVTGEEETDGADTAAEDLLG